MPVSIKIQKKFTRTIQGSARSSELLVFATILACCLHGCVTGCGAGRKHGIFLSCGYGFFGTLVGLATGLVLWFFIYYMSHLLGRLKEKWRPSFPPCENGLCRTQEAYVRVDIPSAISEKIPSLCSYGYKCRCGFVYGVGYDQPMMNRWVRLLPDGNIRAYLVHGFFGRWRIENESPSFSSSGS